MSEYHFIYKDVEGSSTEWDDIQRKLGNLPPKPPAFKPDPFSPAEEDVDPERDPAFQQYKMNRLLLMNNSRTHFWTGFCA